MRKLKIEDRQDTPSTRGTFNIIESALDCVPKEHLSGLSRLVIVDTIDNSRQLSHTDQNLPGLYHPRYSGSLAWMEVAPNILIPQSLPLHKRFFQRFAFKSNLAATIFMLVGQHYFLSLRHSVKKSQIEGLVRAYVQERMKEWWARRNRIRARIFRPLQPTLERWNKSLRKRGKLEMRKKT